MGHTQPEQNVPFSTMGQSRRAPQRDDVKPELRLGARVCQCASCELYFTGLKPFDRHLTGQGTGDVGCLTIDEMRAIGMTTNKYGVWQYGTSLKHLED